MAAAAQPSPVANSNPYSSALAASPSPIASASPGSPIASASPNARRFKPVGTPTSAAPSSSPQHSPAVTAAASPIHSAPQSNSSSQGGVRKVAYDNAAIAAAGTGAASYRAHGVHPPVNTHAAPPPSHVGDHPNSPGGGPTIFSPVYNRTASQEQLHQAEEAARKAQVAAGQTAHGERLRREAEEARYQQQQQAAQYAAQQAAQAQAQAAAQAAAQKHTVSYTPPPVEEDEFDPFMFIKQLPPLSPAMRNRRSPLPKKLLSAPKITLALDLDETLVHCSVQPIDRAELTFKVAFNGMDYEVYVRTRPHMKEFLETVSQWFEVIIFTASQRVYADKLLNIIDPSGRFIQHRVFRDSCVCVDGNYLKDLHILGRELNTVAIVDNSVQAFGFQLDHGIPIESWFDDDNDRELLNLIPFLRTLKDCKDVRPLIRDTFRLSEFVASL
jgi:CTD small phosphatase-like protein 2